MVMKLVLLLIICLLCLCLCLTAEASTPLEYLVKPNCQSQCGNVVIPFPFGIGESCYLNEWYSVNCSNTSGAAKPFLNPTKLNLELLNVSLEYQTVTVYSPIASYDQQKGSSELQTSINLDQSPFLFSTLDNIFVVLGCGHAKLMEHEKIWAGCTSINCSDSFPDQGCYGINCCQTTIPTIDSYYLSTYSVKFTLDDEGNNHSTSTHAFLVDRDWFSRNFTELEDVSVKYAALSLLWMIKEGDNADSSCNGSNYYSLSIGSYVRSSCGCPPRYEGNPYLHDGCDHGFSIGGGSLLLLLGSFGLYKVVKKKKEIRLKKRFFKRNGGLLLEQQISSDKVAVEKTKIFTSKELEKATDNFNLDRILGQGGQGTVYKGMLTDGRIVAVKKSKIVDESQIEHFINEIVILSQISHRNVVGLLGCCLETEVPLLVYEFISNGTLFQHIHNQDSDFPLSWKMRLQIAIEVAGALAYLHSACSIPIYHRDIKSTNILLDDKHRAKVSDFGTSRSISIEQTHLTTLVHGTFGYLDPEYFQSSQFTEKSDVYSFGVVLVELLTGQKPICSTRSQEEKSLATHFILSLQESRLFDILDAGVVKEGEKEEIMALAYLAYQCLNLSGRKRPTMKEITMELEHIRMSLPPLKVEQNFEENACIEMEIIGPLDSTSSFRRSCLNYPKASSSDEQPLLFNAL
ncbi:wall-associated receptor kinase-like 1 isoform X2 [Vitis vinifera]|uniref:wall-associated receptor kinase-like 1 isoform X2 n=1 Tax=Vitis vinifera TaxID=29760 RepID=UPI000198507B|nr:wall-associated receptor kinase-like 1 isoform X2 [Vitis vinifera]|eukprot:XP_010663521.1 PREDICTED: wall-associated receptor kinase-like 1 isoform X2 [Vitis vinifera]